MTVNENALKLWCFEALMFWCFDALMLWCFDALKLWCFEALMFSCFDALILWCFEAVIYRCKKQWSVVNFIYRLKNRHRAVKWRYVRQFSLQPRLCSDISPFIFMSGMFIVSNHRFMMVYYRLSLITVRDSLRIRYLTYIKISAIKETPMDYGIR